MIRRAEAIKNVVELQSIFKESFAERYNGYIHLNENMKLAQLYKNV